MMLEMLPPGLGEALLDAWDYFLHLAVILVPLFIGASFLVGLAQEYLPPEKVERKLRGHDEGTGNVAAAVLRGHIKDIRLRTRGKPSQRTVVQLIVVQVGPSQRTRHTDSTLRQPHMRRGRSSSIRFRTSFSE